MLGKVHNMERISLGSRQQIAVEGQSGKAHSFKRSEIGSADPQTIRNGHGDIEKGMPSGQPKRRMIKARSHCKQNKKDAN